MIKYIKILFLSILFLTLLACDKYESYLIHAKPYEVVSEHMKNLDGNSRKAKMWFITSDANTFDEFAQTTILAAVELHKKYRKYDLIQVILVPDKDMVATNIYYASAFYAVDKKGAKDVSGADQNTLVSFTWLVRSAGKPLNEQEFEIAKLWFNHQSDFPSEVPYSSLGYNAEKLVSFIADSLKLDETEIILPQIILKDYKELDFIK